MRDNETQQILPTVTATEYEALATFRYALRQFLHFSEAAAQQLGLTPQQHQALLTIKGFPGRDRVTVSELSERLQIRHHSAVGLVDRLVAQHLVAREPDTTDRRQVLVALTPRGEAMLAQLTAVHQAELRRIGPELNLLLSRLIGETAHQAEAD